jgi:hypothetical protein
MVKRAWHAQASILGTDEHDRLAFDRWYRDNLYAACHINTTKAAAAEDFAILLARFRMLSRESTPVQVSGWTPSQNARFAELVDKAWTEELRRGSVAQDETFQDWFAQHLEQAGIYGQSAPDRRESFDRVMALFAVIAGDEYWIAKTAQAAEDRMRYVIRGLMAQLSELTGDPVDWNYCRAIYTRMDLPLSIEEATAAWLWKLLQALDTHVRRLGRQGPSRQRKESDAPLPF